MPKLRAIHRWFYKGIPAMLAAVIAVIYRGGQALKLFPPDEVWFPLLVLVAWLLFLYWVFASPRAVRIYRRAYRDWAGEKRIMAYGLAISIGVLIGGATGAGWWKLFEMQRQQMRALQAKEPVLHSGIKADATATVQRKESPNPPILIDLFKQEFPNVLKITDEGTVVRWNNGREFHFKTQLYADFPGKSQFIGFYIPSSPKTYSICLMLANDVNVIRHKLTEGRVVTGGYYRDDKNTLDELTVSGRVLLYHEGDLSIPQKAALIKAYKRKHFDVQFRGPDYLIDQLLAWHREHDPPSNVKQP